MTRFCAGEDSWLARSNNLNKNSGSPDIKDHNGRSRHNKNKRHINSDNNEDTVVNAGFRGSKSGQRKSHSKELLQVRPIWTEYSTARARYTASPEKPANHTNRDCWVFKQVGKLIAENNDKGLHSDDEEETRPPNNRGQKGAHHRCGR